MGHFFCHMFSPSSRFPPTCWFLFLHVSMFCLISPTSQAPQHASLLGISAQPTEGSPPPPPTSWPCWASDGQDLWATSSPAWGSRGGGGYVATLIFTNSSYNGPSAVATTWMGCRVTPPPSRPQDGVDQPCLDVVSQLGPSCTSFASLLSLCWLFSRITVSLSCLSLYHSITCFTALCSYMPHSTCLSCVSPHHTFACLTVQHHYMQSPFHH